MLDDISLWETAVLTDGEAIALFNLGSTPGLAYDASQADQLFSFFDMPVDLFVAIGNLAWKPASGLGGQAGDVLDLGFGRFFLNLDGTNGLVAQGIPEPATLFIASIGLLGMGWMRWRRWQRA